MSARVIHWSNNPRGRLLPDLSEHNHKAPERGNIFRRLLHPPDREPGRSLDVARIIEENRQFDASMAELWKVQDIRVPRIEI